MLGDVPVLQSRTTNAIPDLPGECGSANVLQSRRDYSRGLDVRNAHLFGYRASWHPACTSWASRSTHYSCRVVSWQRIRIFPQGRGCFVDLRAHEERQCSISLQYFVFKAAVIALLHGSETISII